MGVRDWVRRRRQKKKEKESVPQPEKPKEPSAEETKLAVELSGKIEKPTPELVVENKEEVAAEPPTQDTESPTPQHAVEKASPEKIDELPPEAVTEGKEETSEQPPKTEKPAPELTMEETQELVPKQPSSEKEEKPLPSPWKLAFRGLVKRRRKQKEKVKMEEKKEKPEKKEKKSAPEPELLKILIFPITLLSMLLGLSIMPLFPQPLPIILAILIAFLTYKNSIVGMQIGSITIGLGFMYNLSKMNFISMLGEPIARGVIVFVFLFLFIALPLFFHSRRAVISINLGIIAAILLFFAIPLIFTSIVLFKKVAFLTVVYYLLISVPLQVMQYLNVVLQIERWDWWVEPGTSPPIYVPLTGVFTEIQEAMLQFSLYDTSKVVYAITEQIALEPPVMQHNVLEMLSHYMDSLPGIILFLFMVIGVVSVFVFVTRLFMAKGKISYGERLLPILSTPVAVAVFFLLASGLQAPLAFRIDINGTQIAIATFAALIFTLPAVLIDYTPKETLTTYKIMEKARELKAKLQVSEDELDEVKRCLPISCGAFEVKMLMLKDKLDDVLSKTSERLSEASEINEIFNELDSLSREIDKLAIELNIAVGEYQVFVNCEYSKWRGLFKDMGLETEATLKTPFQKEAPLKMKIEQINEVLEAAQSLANEIIKVAEKVYELIRLFYDPNLPEKSQSIAFAQKKLDEKTTLWVALDALFTAMNNWNKQYKNQMSKSAEHLQCILASIANLGTKSERLLPVLGDDFPKVMENAKKAENIKIDIEKQTPNVINVITIKDVFHSSLDIIRETLLIFYEKLKNKEKAIELLAPSEDFSWEKNDVLMKQMGSAIEMTSKSSEVKLSEVLESLSKYLSHLDKCVETMALYNEIEELLLNYPIAEMTVEDLLRKKKSISAKDLPFEPRYAEEYLKLFYSQRYREFSFDKENLLLTKKT